MGMLTGTLGGILRDVLANEPSVLMRKEIYITAAMVGATCFVVASAAGLPVFAASAAGFGAALCLRGGSLLFGWNLPPYKSRPGRMPPGGPTGG